MRIFKLLPTFFFALLICTSTVGQSQVDSLNNVSEELTLHKRVSLGANIGKRSSDLSVKMSAQFLTYVNWKKFDLGLGVNYENEEYFNLIPFYAHLAYMPIKTKNPTKLIIQSGLAFNTPHSMNYDYGKAGIMLSGGIEQQFELFKIIPSSFQILYRFQQTSTVREWTVQTTPDQSNTNSEEIKHSMHRLILVLGFNF
jgi:hypothetical protein